MRSIVWCLVFSTALLWSRPADADLITIEPDAFAAGTNVTAITPGVLLWAALVTGTSVIRSSCLRSTRNTAVRVMTPASFTQCYAATGSMGFSSSSNPEGTLFSWSSAAFPQFASPSSIVRVSLARRIPADRRSLGFRRYSIELSSPHVVRGDCRRLEL